MTLTFDLDLDLEKIAPGRIFDLEGPLVRFSILCLDMMSGWSFMLNVNFWSDPMNRYDVIDVSMATKPVPL